MYWANVPRRIEQVRRFEHLTCSFHWRKFDRFQQREQSEMVDRELYLTRRPLSDDAVRKNFCICILEVRTLENLKIATMNQISEYFYEHGIVSHESVRTWDLRKSQEDYQRFALRSKAKGIIYHREYFRELYRCLKTYRRNLEVFILIYSIRAYQFEASF